MQVVLEEAEDGTLVTQQDLPADRPDQEAREEGGDDEEQQEVLVSTAPERDRVRDREPDEEIKYRRHAAVEQRVAELDREFAECVGVRLRRAGDVEAAVERPGRDRHQE